MVEKLGAIALSLMLAMLIGSPAIGQTLKDRVDKRFTVIPIADGIVLTPKFKTDVKSVEVSEQKIAVDGLIMTGGEVRQKLGDDADLVLQLSYLDVAQQRSLLGLTGAASAATATQQTADQPDQPQDRAERRSKRNGKGDEVRFGGSVEVDENEHIAGDVVAIGGSVTVNGEVDGDTVAIGGSLKLGPHAHVHGDAVSIGGSLDRDPAAVVDGEAKEVGFGGVSSGRHHRSWNGPSWGSWSVNPAIKFGGTIVRIVLVLLLASIVLLVARTPVEQIADRVAAEPLKSWAVGFLVEILFVPVLIISAVVLAISIIGIPLLLALPVAVIALFVAALVGFTGVAYHVGRLMEGKVEAVKGHPFAVMALGIVVIVTPLLIARLMAFMSPIYFLAVALAIIGFIIELIAWTTGLGAAVLTRFNRPAAPTAADLPPAPVPPVHPGVA